MGSRHKDGQAQHSVRDSFASAAIAIILAIVLARLSQTSYTFAPSSAAGSAAVFWPLALHVAAICCYLLFFRHSTPSHSLGQSEDQSENQSEDQSQKAPGSADPQVFSPLWLLPGFAVWLFSVLCWGLGSKGDLGNGDFTTIPMDYPILASITIIPIVEELYFRAGLSELWRRACGPYLGSLAAAVYFAVLHGNGDIFSANLLTWLPLGPFLLALCCEILYRRTKRIRVACYFHLSCNLSAVLFYYGLPFDFLRYFYIS